MTQEEKAKAYEEALKCAKMYYKENKDYNAGFLPIIFPELAESEDERIRKRIYGLIYHNDALLDKNELLTWLEKQKDIIQDKVEQRMEYLWNKLPDANRVEEGNCTPEEWKALGAYMELEMNFDKGSEEKQKEPHYTKRNALFDKCVENCDPEVMKKVSDEVDDMLEKEPKPAEWSDEDEAMRNNIIRILSAFVGTLECDSNPSLSSSYPTYLREIDWLKSLRPSWKPTEEEERLINTTISFLKDFADKGYENAVECIDWLKSKLNEKSINA